MRCFLISVMLLGLIIGQNDAESQQSRDSRRYLVDRSTILFMSFDEIKDRIVRDESKNNNHGTIYGEYKIEKGKFGKGLYFNGINTYIIVPSNDSLNVKNEVTISIWIKPDKDLTEDSPTMFLAGKRRSYWLQYEGGKVKLYFVDNNGKYWGIEKRIILSANTWYHIMASYDGQQMVLYINGEKQSYLRAKFEINVNNIDFTIGAIVKETPKNLFQGIIDQVIISSEAKTPSSVSAINEARGKMGEENLALGKKYLLQPDPNYILTVKGETDKRDLTDGKVSSKRALWYEQDAVAWAYQPYVRIIIDLEKVMPVGSVKIHLQGGGAQRSILFPQTVEVLASEDRKLFYPVCTFEKDVDARKFGIPEEKGVPWTHWLEFRNLKTRGRFIAIVIRSSGFMTVLDEIQVIKGKFKPEDVQFAGRPVDLNINGITFYFPRNVYRFSRNILTPGYFGCLDTRQDKTGNVWLTIITPPGLWVEAAILGRDELISPMSYKKTKGLKVYRDIDEVGNNILKAQVKTYNDRSWGRLWLNSKDWKDGESGEMKFIAKWGNEPENVSITTQRVEAFTIPPARRPNDLLVFGLGTYPIEYLALWPDVFNVFKHLGFNVIPACGVDDVHWSKFFDDVHKHGFKVAFHVSPFHNFFKERWDKEPEVFCQLPGGKTSGRLCPSYRGKYYKREINKIANEYSITRAEWVFLDTELWGWKGPEKWGAKQCSRCRARFEEMGLDSWEKFFEAMGKELMEDVVNGIKKKAAEIGINKVYFGSFNIYPGGEYQPYQHAWRFLDLYPETLQIAQPAYYSPLLAKNLEELRNLIANARDLLPQSDIVPWLTPGDSGEFPPIRMEYAIYECLLNGARGITWWSARSWEPEDFYHYSRVIDSVAGVEDIIISGKKVDSFTSSSGRIHVEALKKGKEILMLLSNYKDDLPVEETIISKKFKIRSVKDRESGKDIPLFNNRKKFKIKLENKRTKLLHLIVDESDL